MLAAEMCSVWPLYSVSPGRLPPTMMSTPWLPRMRWSRPTSASRGTLSRISVWSVSRLAIISGRVAFFAPEIGIVPLRWRPPTILMRSMLRSPQSAAASATDDRSAPRAQSAIEVKVIAALPVRGPACPARHGSIAAKVGTAWKITGFLPLARLVGRQARVGRGGFGGLLGGPPARLRLAPPEVLLERLGEPLGPPLALARLALRHGASLSAAAMACPGRKGCGRRQISPARHTRDPCAGDSRMAL